MGGGPVSASLQVSRWGQDWTGPPHPSDHTGGVGRRECPLSARDQAGGLVQGAERVGGGTGPASQAVMLVLFLPRISASLLKDTFPGLN